MDIKYEDIDNKIGVLVFKDFPFTTAQTATNYGYIYTSPFPFEVLSVIEKHNIAGTDLGAVTLDVLNVANGTAISGGVSILAATFDLKSTAATAVMKKGLDLNANRGFNPLDSIALKLTGTATTLEGLQVTIYLKPRNRGGFR